MEQLTGLSRMQAAPLVTFSSPPPPLSTPCFFFGSSRSRSSLLPASPRRASTSHCSCCCAQLPISSFLFRIDGGTYVENDGKVKAKKMQQLSASASSDLSLFKSESSRPSSPAKE
eukprot:406418-Rhodomonas_salina.1